MENKDPGRKILQFERYAFFVELITTGILISLISIIGPLILEIIKYQTNLSSIIQLKGNDLMGLLLISPLVLLSAYGFITKKNFTKYFLVGTGTFQLYTYLSYVLGIDYGMYSGNNEQFFYLFVYLIITAYFNTTMGVKMFSKDIPANLSIKGSKIIGTIMLIFAIVFSYLWISEISEVILTGDLNDGMYSESPVGFWTIRTFDMVWSIPSMFFTSYLILTRPQSCYNTVIIFLSFGAFFVTAPFAMVILMYFNNDPFITVGHIIFFTTLMIMIWSVYIWFVNEKEKFIHLKS